MWRGTYVSLMLKHSLIYQTVPSCSAMTGLNYSAWVCSSTASQTPPFPVLCVCVSVCANMDVSQIVRLDLGNDILVLIVQFCPEPRQNIQTSPFFHLSKNISQGCLYLAVTQHILYTHIHTNTCRRKPGCQYGAKYLLELPKAVIFHVSQRIASAVTAYLSLKYTVLHTNKLNTSSHGRPLWYISQLNHSVL